MPRREQAAEVVRRAGGARTGVCSRRGVCAGAFSLVARASAFSQQRTLLYS